MFDPLLTIRLWGTRVATRASCVVVLAVVVGGVLSRMAAAEGRHGTGVGWFVAGSLTVVVLGAAVCGHELVRIWVARRQGLAVRRVELGLFGGSSGEMNATVSPRTEVVGALIAFGALAGVAV